MEEIRNKVQESELIQLDLADFKPKGEIIALDIAPALWEGIVLKEKDFRAWIKEHDWSQYKSKNVYVFCSEDAIIPTWAFMLVGSSLIGNCDNFIIGTKLELEKALILKNIQAIKVEDYVDAKIIIKGCADIADPSYSMTEILRVLQAVAKSIMYGEPCSTVPLYKRK